MHVKLNYTSIEARRHGHPGERVEIHNNSTLTEVSRVDDGLSINFTFTSDYGKDVGFIKIEGDLLLSGTEESVDDVIREWNESNKKSLPAELAERVHNTIIANCIVEATILSRDIQLPAPSPSPRISIVKREITESESGNDGDTSSYIR